MNRIAVTGTGSLIGQGIIKSILRSKISDKVEIVGFDYFNDTIGSYLVKKNHLFPDILKDNVSEKDWINTVIHFFLKEKIELVFIGVDFELELFSRNKTLIESKTNAKIIVSNLKTIQIANDKFLTYKFLKEAKLNFPKTNKLSEISLNELSFPKILKPRIGYRSRNVFLLKNLDDFNNLRIKNIDDYIIQEYLGCDNQEYTCGTITINNTFRSIVLKRKLNNGNTSVAEHSEKYNSKIKEYIFKVNNILKPFGPCNYQLRVDSKGNPKIFEINLRHSGTTYIRSLFGFNEVEFLLNKILFKKEMEFNLNYGKAVRYFEEKLV